MSQRGIYKEIFQRGKRESPGATALVAGGSDRASWTMGWFHGCAYGNESWIGCDAEFVAIVSDGEEVMMVSKHAWSSLMAMSGWHLQGATGRRPEAPIPSPWARHWRYDENRVSLAVWQKIFQGVR